MTRNCIWMGVFSQVVTLPWSDRAARARIRHWIVPVASPPPGSALPGGPPDPLVLVRRDGVRVAGQGPVELAAGADAELGEDLAQVVLHRAGADEQPGGDLRIGQAVPGQPGDLGLLGGQLAAGRHGALAGGLPGSRQLAAGPPCA